MRARQRGPTGSSRPLGEKIKKRSMAQARKYVDEVAAGDEGPPEGSETSHLKPAGQSLVQGGQVPRRRKAA